MPVKNEVMVCCANCQHFNRGHSVRHGMCNQPTAKQMWPGGMIVHQSDRCQLFEAKPDQVNGRDY